MYLRWHANTRARVIFTVFLISTVSHFDVFLIWFAIIVALFYLTLPNHLYLFFHLLLLLHWFVINYSRNSLPEYVNMEWSPLWLVNRIHEHSVNSCIFAMPTWYWMVPSSSNAYFSTEHSSDCYRKKKWKEKEMFKIKSIKWSKYNLSYSWFALEFDILQQNLLCQ